MPRVQPIDYAASSTEVRTIHDRVVAEHGRITNMKITLLRSMPAFRALMEWYPLHETVEPFLGERLTNLYTHAISSETDCLICSTFFRRLLIDAGENPDDFTMDERERVVIEYGRALAHQGARVPDELYRQVAALFTEEQIVALTAFGAMMVATNIFNNALEVELDEYLEGYRRPAPAHNGDRS
jgi:alkylhydroperoxidase family enzyme